VASHQGGHPGTQRVLVVVRPQRPGDDVGHLGEVLTPKPRVASAGVPMRSPELTIGGRGSLGTAFR